jgi:hypothetical protein
MSKYKRDDTVPEELDFERGDERTGRIGDPRPEKEIREEFPGRRTREAGMTGGETPDRDGEVTADDLSPETLLDSEPSRTPHSTRARKPSDTAMRTVGVEGVGVGGGLDEAEMAERSPVGREAAAATERKARRHAADPNMVEPHEAQERTDTKRQAERTKAADK